MELSPQLHIMILKMMMLTTDSDLFDVDDNPNNNKNITINKINKYYGNTSKSVFDIKDFEMS